MVINIFLVVRVDKMVMKRVQCLRRYSIGVLANQRRDDTQKKKDLANYPISRRAQTGHPLKALDYNRNLVA